MIVCKKDCTGCMACKNICPQLAITIEESDGFDYPIINNEKCIGCNLCKKVCPIISCDNESPKEILAYACQNKDENTRKKSSSGGIFTLLSKYILDKNGAVYGVAFNNFFDAEHIRVDKNDDLEKLRGSKYIQSNIGNTFKNVKNDIKDGKLVLFSGTPCQIEGLKKFLGNDYDNLFLQDIICHGVPSKKLFKKYLEDKIKDNGRINKYYFRYKGQKGWSKFQICIEFDDGNKEYIDHSNDSFMNFFLKDIVLRESCYNCKFKKKYRNSDITLADFWGIDNIYPEMNDEKGTSLVIINSNKGKRIFNLISDKLYKVEVNIDEAIKYNNNMIESPNISLRNQEIFKDIEKMEYCDLVNKYLKQS